ncbi:hypothetical protein CE139_21085 [Pseudomonas oryzihabitans]|uniref:Uncharacterized protein n=1 Tax=Pseudomonas oryzihabitans TaxID=47885 RepID=A0A2Z5AC77_9PSED|nr:hypothetical protein CE139_21085 [Pseudomonas oryzihabitans]
MVFGEFIFLDIKQVVILIIMEILILSRFPIIWGRLLKCSRACGKWEITIKKDIFFSLLSAA